jgi:hypothetical protein
MPVCTARGTPGHVRAHSVHSTRNTRPRESTQCAQHAEHQATWEHTTPQILSISQPSHRTPNKGAPSGVQMADRADQCWSALLHLTGPHGPLHFAGGRAGGQGTSDPKYWETFRTCDLALCSVQAGETRLHKVQWGPEVSGKALFPNLFDVAVPLTSLFISHGTPWGKTPIFLKIDLLSNY